MKTREYRIRFLLWTVTGAAFAALTMPVGLAAQSYTVLYAFSAVIGENSGGQAPYAPVVRDAAGNLYGTTFGGGAYLNGVVFKLSPNGTENVLYSFTGATDGKHPWAGLLRDASGALYGTTRDGGSTNDCEPDGCGVVFRLNPPATFCRTVLCPWIDAVLYTFQASLAEGNPYAGVIQDSAGNLYGTTTNSGNGTAFELTPNGQETILHHFGGDQSGPPYAGLVRDSAGNLYGATFNGPSTRYHHWYGEIFMLDPAGNVTVLYKFQGGSDGAGPWGSLVQDPAGNLYGTTYAGGGSSACTGGCGTVFKVDINGNETVLHRFSGYDGENPSAGLVRDTAGNLYGTTYIGGASGLGVVFKVDPNGNETTLHNFSGAEGATPAASLILDSAGNLYGTTAQGGPGGGGVVFKLTP